MLVSAEGLTLYGFVNDVDAISTCYSTCAEAWPPVIVDEEWTVGPGLDTGVFSTTERDDGTLQLVAGKFPLYTFGGDAAPGDLTGQGSGDVWFAVGLDGALLEDDAATDPSVAATAPETTAPAAVAPASASSTNPSSVSPSVLTSSSPRSLSPTLAETAEATAAAGAGASVVVGATTVVVGAAVATAAGVGVAAAASSSSPERPQPAAMISNGREREGELGLHEGSWSFSRRPVAQSSRDGCRKELVRPGVVGAVNETRGALDAARVEGPVLAVRVCASASALLTCTTAPAATVRGRPKEKSGILMATGVGAGPGRGPLTRRGERGRRPSRPAGAPAAPR